MCVCNAQAQCNPFSCGPLSGVCRRMCVCNAQAQCNPFSCGPLSGVCRRVCVRNSQAQCNPFSCGHCCRNSHFVDRFNPSLSFWQDCCSSTQWRCSTRAVLIDRAGDQLLAGAALAGDRHGHVLGGDTADRLVNLANGAAGTDDAIPGVQVCPGLLRYDRPTDAAGDVQRLGNDPPQLGKLERREETVIGALLNGLNCRIGPPGTSDDDDRQVRVDATDLLIDLQPGLVGQTEIQDNNIGCSTGSTRPSRCTGGSRNSIRPTTPTMPPWPPSW
jgi:hypothetical protein